MKDKERFIRQEKQYQIPYHYLVDFKPYNNVKRLNWGLEYYSYMKYTMRYISKLKFDNLLDIGCGDGRLLSELSRVKKDAKFLGVDLSVPAILLAQGLNYGQDNLSFIHGDFKVIKQNFDAIVLNEVLEHIPDDYLIDFTSAVQSKLKKKGLLIVTVPSDNFPTQKKHYRHYNVTLLKETFNQLEMCDIAYLYKYNLLIQYFIGFVTRFDFLKPFELWVGEKFLFKATQHNGRHIFCVFKKNS